MADDAQDKPKTAKKAAKKKKSRRSKKPLWMPILSELQPSLGFDALKRPLARWEGVKGHPFVLKGFFRSQGVASSGLRVAVGGAAVEQGHVAIERLTCGEQSEAFTVEGAKAVSSLPIEIPAGYEYPYSPKPKKEDEKERGRSALEISHIEVEIHGKALSTGQGMLRLELSVSDDTATLKWIRPFVVHETAPKPPPPPPEDETDGADEASGDDAS